MIDPESYNYAVLDEFRGLSGLMFPIILYCKYLNDRGIDDSWFNRYFENIKRVGENYRACFDSNFYPNIYLSHNHALILTAIPPESANLVVKEYVNHIKQFQTISSAQNLDLYFYKTLLLTLVDFKTYEQNIDYRCLPDYIVDAMQDMSIDEKFYIVCKIIAQLKKINENNEKISTLKKAIESVIDGEYGENEE